jgi:hypothetical protein
MKRLTRIRPSPAMIIACIALLVALGGTSVAAIQALPKNSVGSKQLEKNSVGTKQLKNGAVTGAKVRAHTLNASKLAAGVLPDLSGYYTKTQSDSNYYSKTQSDSNYYSKTQSDSNYYSKSASDGRYLRGTVVEVASATVPATSFNSVTALCPSGYQAIGGGVDSNQVDSMYVTASGPVFGTPFVRLRDTLDGEHAAASGWYVAAHNSSGSIVYPLKVAAICAPIG